MTRPRVSICMPCYNAAPYLRQALDSALGQAYPEIEIVAVDDGSTDGTGEILSDYAANGVRVLRQANAGQSAASNAALGAATGDLVKFLDADDILAPDMVERQVARLGDRRDAIAMGEWTRFYGEDHATARFEPLLMYRDADPVDWLVSEWMGAEAMMQAAIWLVPRAVLERSGPWDEELTLLNDFEFFTRVLLAAREIVYSPGARFYYRSGLQGSVSRRKDRRSVISAFHAVTRGTDRLLAQDDGPRTRRACANVLINFDYTYYPLHADLRAEVRARAARLGGADLEPDGPPRFQRLRRYIGWRAARRVQRLAGRMP